MRKGFALPLILVILVISASVIVGGFYLLKSKPTTQPQSDNSTQPASTSSPKVVSTPASDNTANWNAYTFKQIGLYLKYPNTWQFDSPDPKRLTTTRATDKKTTGDYTPGTASVLIDARAGLDQESLQAYSAGVAKTEEVTIDGIKSKKYTGTEGIGVHFVRVIAQPKDTYTYIISFSTQDEDLLSDLTNEFNQILSTIKFVPIVN